MNTIRPCGCKGVRTCLQCENNYNINKPSLQNELQKMRAFSYCISCQRLYAGWHTSTVQAAHPAHAGEVGIPFPGILVQENFLNATESATLVDQLDQIPWTVSQSGRRKQNFGPKTNFKKRKLRNGSFQGFPASTQYIQERLRQVDLLSDFQSIEQCSLEYDASKGASIDPHIDDCWIWGERVVTVNCLGDAVLTLTLYDEKMANSALNKYNRDFVTDYEDKLLLALAKPEELSKFENCVIRIPMPNLSLIVMYGPPRYQFEHAVLREDIYNRRVCIAYREFTPMYLEGGVSHKEGIDIINQSQNFF